jgi:hypothetical protein
MTDLTNLPVADLVPFDFEELEGCTRVLILLSLSAFHLLAAEDVPSVDGMKGGCSAASKEEGGGSMRTSTASELWKPFLISSSTASLCHISISLKLVPAAAVLVLVLASEVMEDCRGLGEKEDEDEAGGNEAGRSSGSGGDMKTGA